MEIRKSMGRFLSIFFIVALGVSLFVGIAATEPDMILSGDTPASFQKKRRSKYLIIPNGTETNITHQNSLPIY